MPDERSAPRRLTYGRQAEVLVNTPEQVRGRDVDGKTAGGVKDSAGEGVLGGLGAILARNHSLCGFSVSNSQGFEAERWNVDSRGTLG